MAYTHTPPSPSTCWSFASQIRLRRRRRVLLPGNSCFSEIKTERRVDDTNKKEIKRTASAAWRKIKRGSSLADGKREKEEGGPRFKSSIRAFVMRDHAYIFQRTFQCPASVFFNEPPKNLHVKIYPDEFRRGRF